MSTRRILRRFRSWISRRLQKSAGTLRTILGTRFPACGGATEIASIYFYWSEEGKPWGNADEVFKWAKLGVERGNDPDAYAWLYLCYNYGVGTAENKRKARKVLKEGTEKGSENCKKMARRKLTFKRKIKWQAQQKYSLCFYSKPTKNIKNGKIMRPQKTAFPTQAGMYAWARERILRKHKISRDRFFQIRRRDSAISRICRMPALTAMTSDSNFPIPAR